MLPLAALETSIASSAKVGLLDGGASSVRVGLLDFSGGNALMGGRVDCVELLKGFGVGSFVAGSGLRFGLQACAGDAMGVSRAGLEVGVRLWIGLAVGGGMGLGPWGLAIEDCIGVASGESKVVSLVLQSLLCRKTVVACMALLPPHSVHALSS